MSLDIDEAAARWHLAQSDDDMDWAAFTLWLEADPRHREAYDAIALLDERIDRARPVLNRLLADDHAPRARRPFRVAAWLAVAATLVAAILLGIARLPFGSPGESIAYRAPIGRIRQIQLPDGSSATLSPGSVLRVSPSRDTAMILDGNAYFDVRHDAAHPLTVRAGDFVIRDVGTRFDVSSSDGVLRVAVAEGRVAIRSPNAAGEVEIGAGKALTLTGGSSAAYIRPATPGSIGAWRNGPLVYDDVPLSLVVADIGRTTGKRVTIAPSAAARRFSGVIAQGDRTAMVAMLAQLTGLNAQADGDAIRLSDRAGR